MVNAADDIGLPASKLKGIYDTLNSEGGKAVVGIMAAAAIIGGIVSLFNALAELTDEVGNKFGAIGVTKFKSDLINSIENLRDSSVNFILIDSNLNIHLSLEAKKP